MRIFLLILFSSIQIAFINAQSDINPPVLNSLSISPASVNNGDSITITIDITDDISGINGIGFPGLSEPFSTQAIISDPRGANIGQYVFASNWKHVSGNIYYAKAKISDYALSGTWKVEWFSAVDNWENSHIYYNGTDFNATFQVASSSPDIKPPVLNSLSVSPASVNNGDSITITIDITDDISGVNGIGFPGLSEPFSTQAFISDPSYNQRIYARKWKHVSGNIYSAKEKISDYANSGTWQIYEFYVKDNAGNVRNYINGSDFNATFQVISSNPDTTPPVLNSLSVSPANVNNGDSITVTIDVTDDISGIDIGNVEAVISNPNSTQYTFANSWHQVNGNIYYAKAKIPGYAVNATWKVDRLYVADKAGNNKAYDNCTYFFGAFIIGSAIDKTAPNFAYVKVSPLEVFPGDSVTITVSMMDVDSYVNGIGLPGYNSSYASSLVTIQNAQGTLSSANNIWKAISCDEYCTKVMVPLNTASGTWNVLSINAYDRAGNNKLYIYGTDYTNSYSYPSSFYVNNVSGISSNQLKDNMGIYPNPTNGNITIDISNINKITSIIVYNVLGEEVMEKTPGYNVSEVNINMENLSKGIYSLIILSYEEKKIVRIVKE